VSDVSKFVNRTNISINVYCYDSRCIVPLEITKEEKELRIDLLYLTEKANIHYCLIQNLSRLVRSQITKHEKTTHLYRMCLNKFGSEINLKDYKTLWCTQICKNRNANALQQYLTVRNYNHSLKVPFKVCAEFECILQKIQTCQPSDEASYTNAYQKHVPVSFAYHIKYCNGDYKASVEYTGPDAPKVFFQNMKEEGLHIKQKYYDKVFPIKPLTETERKEFKTQKICHICGRSLNVLPPLLVKRLLN
jgi:hypothetical protein